MSNARNGFTEGLAQLRSRYADEVVAHAVAMDEAHGAGAFGGVPCPHQLPHGHGRDGSAPFDDACPSCGAVT